MIGWKHASDTQWLNNDQYVNMDFPYRIFQNYLRRLFSLNCLQNKLNTKRLIFLKV